MVKTNLDTQKFDFQIVKSSLLKLCTFAIGKERVETMSFFTDFNALESELSVTSEMLAALTDKEVAMPGAEMHDLRDQLMRIRIEGLFLDENELFTLRKSLDAFQQWQTYLKSLNAERYPRLRQLRQENDDLLKLVAEIDRILDKYGQLRDSASPALAAIRQTLLRSQNAVQKTLITILKQAQVEGIIDKDVSPTLREGRLVLPLPPMYKRKFGGIVHDESASGKTIFIEPQQVVEANNRIRELESDERRERVRILTEFADTLRPYLPQIQQSQTMLGTIDFIRAKALYAQQIGAIMPQLSDKPLVDWREARHPVLEQRLQAQGKQVVPLTIRLDDKNRILLISGPNAGGKSVCLKTVALLQYMLQTGMLIPVREDSNAGMFRQIMIDIGDEQSIEDDLSTYSSHLRNMKRFLLDADSRTLLLIDEFGGGTEPHIGGAIAEAILAELVKKNCFGVVTTHYDNLKHFAADTDGLQNGAMLYDRGQLKPLFQLSMGQPGSSFAIEIATQTGLPQSVIEHAKNLVGDEYIDYDRHLQDIARDKRYWENKRQQVRIREKQLEERIQQYDEKMASIKQKQKQMLTDAQQQAEELLRQSNVKIENTIRRIKQTNADKQETKTARQELETFKQQVQKIGAKNKEQGLKVKEQKTKEQPAKGQEITVGDIVRVAGQTMSGEVLAISGQQAEVAFGLMKSKVPLKKLEYVSRRQLKQQARTNIPSNIADSVRQKQLTFRDQLDVRGLRAKEAMEMITNYLDDAIMIGVSQVRILHGTGTGALRQMLRQMLENNTHIKAYYDAHPDSGGAGITIIDI
ncbi:MAG: endonuclease MutS2 [Paludibacteraceae bacterium]|nr:endonuclease MutS2 [Paludibacteraceae bacterium]